MYLRYSRYIVKIYSWYVLDMPELFQVQAWDMSEMILWCNWDEPKMDLIELRCTWDKHEICLIYTWDMLDLRYTWDKLVMYPGWEIWWTNFRYDLRYKKWSTSTTWCCYFLLPDNIMMIIIQHSLVTIWWRGYTNKR